MAEEGLLLALIFGGGFFGTIWYGLTILGRAITGRSNSRELQALREEVAQLRREFADTLCGQDDQVQRLSERVRSIEQALPAAGSGASSEEVMTRVRRGGS